MIWGFFVFPSPPPPPRNVHVNAWADNLIFWEVRVEPRTRSSQPQPCTGLVASMVHHQQGGFPCTPAEAAQLGTASAQLLLLPAPSAPWLQYEPSFQLKELQWGQAGQLETAPMLLPLLPLCKPKAYLHAHVNTHSHRMGRSGSSMEVASSCPAWVPLVPWAGCSGFAGHTQLTPALSCERNYLFM